MAADVPLPFAQLAAQFSSNIQGVDVDRFGNVYVADAKNARIRKIDVQRNVTTVAGTGTGGDDDNAGTIPEVRYLAVDDSDSVYVSSPSGKIRVFRNGQLYTVLVAGLYSGDGFAKVFQFIPSHMAVNKATGRLFTGQGGLVFSLDALVP